MADLSVATGEGEGEVDGKITFFWSHTKMSLSLLPLRLFNALLTVRYRFQIAFVALCMAVAANAAPYGPVAVVPAVPVGVVHHPVSVVHSSSTVVQSHPSPPVAVVARAIVPAVHHPAVVAVHPVPVVHHPAVVPVHHPVPVVHHPAVVPVHY